MKALQRILGTLFGCVLTVFVPAVAQTPPNTDVLGSHDMSNGSSPVRGPNANACVYCHAPHNALSTTPLWNQTLSTKQYDVYPGTTGTPGTAITVGRTSQLCLSCHDGTVAVGLTLGIGTLQMMGALQPSGTLTNNLGTKLEGSHPFSLQPAIKDAPSLVASLAASHTTKDSAVSLVNSNIECNTCHDVHNQYRDKRELKFLVRDNLGSALCFACHDTGARNVNGRDNTLTGWPTSAHGLSEYTVARKAGLGGYSTVKEFACQSCHSSHNALGMGLLRKNANRPPNVDDTSQTCFICHDGSDNLATPLRNVLAGFQAPGNYAHPFADANNGHALNEPVVLDRNRHTTCADCHASHSAQPTATFPVTPNLRPAQTGVSGVSLNGTIVNTATYQYENCLRCHGASAEKKSLAAYGYMPFRGQFAGDILDVSLELAHGATSSHPVMRDASAAEMSRPSLLQYVYNIDFKQGRAMSNRLLCTDCHNHDDNREFGGQAPNGSHGSKYEHILERQYVISRVASGAAPGSTIVNLNLPPVLDPIPTAPYALCAKCHDLNNVNSGASWNQHKRHIEDGFSCSVCHSAHGVPAGTTGVNGMGLVSFDLNVVGQNGSQPITYNGNNCTLTCHDHAH